MRRDDVDVPASAVSGDSASSSGVPSSPAGVSPAGVLIRRFNGVRALVSVSTPTTPSASAPSTSGAGRLLSGDLANLFWLLDHGLRRFENGLRRLQRGGDGLLGRSDSCGAVHGIGLGWLWSLAAGAGGRAQVRSAGATNSTLGATIVGGMASTTALATSAGRGGAGRSGRVSRRGGFGGDLLRRTAPRRPGRRWLPADACLGARGRYLGFRGRSGVHGFARGAPPR